jgi:hypothetical protein
MVEVLPGTVVVSATVVDSGAVVVTAIENQFEFFSSENKLKNSF